MRFKKLELLGFKSFAESTELVFEPGVTAVVGPNGCGKSNVADAIKWVLGEQSPRELRGGRMEDLIFNGSERRDPIHYAEVSLTLDNSEKKLAIEYAEITISRRLFRTGESEYLLNRTPVRLRDIQELLMGTGVGTSAYSLFEQGRIEQIISARPEERRTVFEEAAGITKFKTQKREAMRRLEETEENLARVGDVVAEVKRQIQSLERQVRRARAYQEQMERLKGMESELGRRKSGLLARRRQEKEGVLGSLRSQVQEVEGRSGQQEQLLTQARERVNRAEEVLSRAREALLGARHRQESVRGNLEMNRERVAEAQGRQKQILRSVEESQARIGELEEERKQLAEQISREEGERRQKEERIGQCRLRAESCACTIAEAERLIDETRQQVLGSTAAQVQARNGLARVRQEAARLEARQTRLQAERGKVTREREEASAQAESLRQALIQSRTVVEGLEAERALCEENRVSTEAALGEVEREVHALEQELTRCASQVDLLKGLLASHEGYSSGVKSLLTALDQGKLEREGVSGVLAELIQIERRDAAAVDAALGPWAEAVVVETAAVAERCRQFLESSKAGRVLFLIRDRAPQEVSPAPDAAPAAGTAQKLMDRIGITPHLGPLMNLLLAETWLVPDRAAAQRMLGQVRNAAGCLAWRWVTQGGELYGVTSALVGSTPAEEGMVVGRLSRLQSLEVTVGQVQGRLEEARTRRDGLRSQQDAQAEAISTVEKSLQEKSQEQQRLEATGASADAAVAKLNQELQLLEVEHSETAAELQDVQVQLHQAEQELAARDQELAGLEQAIARAQEAIAGSVREREEISVELATAKAQLSSLDEVASSRRASLAVLERSVQEAQAQVRTRKEELASLGGRQTEWEAASAGLERQCAELEAGMGRLLAEVQEAEGGRARALEAATAQEREFLAIRRRLEDLQSQLHTQEMEQAQIAFEQEQIASRLRQVYQIDLDEREEPMGSDPAGSDPIDLDDQQLQARIEELSSKLQRIGPVNLGSIEEERELQGRYEFLTQQQGDLVRAKEDLHEALSKINRTTRAMFRETFQAIQKEFQVTFRQLFGGGEARLVLMDEEDLLESGIEIIARPPGKPLQPISLLSGGEKALTTIALLFSIFRVKPSPFCVLDEIDAPLDEPNIDRFTRALKEFLKDSQFIIITHNKKTISMADVIYGITMQEMGVSKIVSVKFKKEQEGAPNGNGALVKSPGRLSPPPPAPGA